MMEEQITKTTCVHCGKEFIPNEHMWWCDECWKKRQEAQQKGSVRPIRL